MSQWPAATVRYVFVGYVLIPLVINVAINVLLGGLLFLGQESIPVWSFPQSVAMEIVGTGFLLPLITAMISSRVLIRHLRSGMVQPILKTEASSGIISRLLVVLRGGLSVFDDPSIPRSPRRFSGSVQADRNQGRLRGAVRCRGDAADCLWIASPVRSVAGVKAGSFAVAIGFVLPTDPYQLNSPTRG